MTNYCLFLTTCNSQEMAETLAYQLVEKKLVVCVNIVPQITSIYRWQGKIETDQEWLLLLKSQRDYYSAIEQFIIEHHPYQTPELLSFDIAQGLPAYLNWLHHELA
jgi:periplasmic divalent cation tolerance protein